MLDTVSRILFVVSSSVLVPVILALLAAAAWMVLLAGGFLSELRARMAARRPLAAVVDGLMHGTGSDTATARIGALTDSIPPSGFVARYLRTCWDGKTTSLAAEKVIDEIEMEMARRVAGLSLLARLGPMLGLTGTLIPLGPGLVDLARGNVAGLASQLVIAFSTTVVGLLVGMAAFACGQVRRGWYAKDLNDILFLEEARPGEAGETR